MQQDAVHNKCNITSSVQPPEFKIIINDQADCKQERSQVAKPWSQLVKHFAMLPPGNDKQLSEFLINVPMMPRTGILLHHC